MLDTTMVPGDMVTPDVPDRSWIMFEKPSNRVRTRGVLRSSDVALLLFIQEEDDWVLVLNQRGELGWLRKERLRQVGP